MPTFGEKRATIEFKRAPCCSFALAEKERHDKRAAYKSYAAGATTAARQLHTQTSTSQSQSRGH
jgi:hypothetical protein